MGFGGSEGLQTEWNAGRGRGYGEESTPFSYKAEDRYDSCLMQIEVEEKTKRFPIEPKTTTIRVTDKKRKKSKGVSERKRTFVTPTLLKPFPSRVPT